MPGQEAAAAVGGGVTSGAGGAGVPDISRDSGSLSSASTTGEYEQPSEYGPFDGLGLLSDDGLFLGDEGDIHACVGHEDDELAQALGDQETALRAPTGAGAFAIDHSADELDAFTIASSAAPTSTAPVMAPPSSVEVAAQVRPPPSMSPSTTDDVGTEYVDFACARFAQYGAASYEVPVLSCPCSDHPWVCMRTVQVHPCDTPDSVVASLQQGDVAIRRIFTLQQDRDGVLVRTLCNVSASCSGKHCHDLHVTCRQNQQDNPHCGLRHDCPVTTGGREVAFVACKKNGTSCT